MSLRICASLAAMLTLNVAAAAVAATPIRLAGLAASAGYAYAWLPSEGGVSLKRPGVVIILHAGYPLYEVNATPMQADRPPVFDGGDLIVSPALAARLRHIAATHPGSPPVTYAAQSAGAMQVTRPIGAHGATLSVNAQPINGRSALAVSGVAGAGAAVVVTLTGEISVDVPIVVLSRNTVIANDDGTFSFVASIDSETHRGTVITIDAASAGASAVTHVTVGAPSPGINSSLDQFPPK